MAELPLDQAIPRFKTNEDRIDKFTNGSSTETVTTSDGQQYPTIRKFLADKSEEIDAAVEGFVEDLIGDQIEEIDASVDRAQEWSEKATDNPVVPGQFSAKHHATKAAASAAAALASQTAAGVSAGIAQQSAEDATQIVTGLVFASDAESQDPSVTGKLIDSRRLNLVTNKRTYSLEAFRSAGASDRAALQSYFDTAAAGLAVVLDAGRTYSFDAAASALNRSVNIIGNGATISLAAGAGRESIVRVVQDYLGVSPVTSITTVSIDFGGGAVPCTRLVVGAGAAVLAVAAVGRTVKAFEDQIIPWSNSVDNERVAEHAVIAAVNTDSIDLVGRLSMPFLVTGQNTRVAVQSNNQVSISNLGVTIATTSSQRDAPAIYLQGCDSPTLQDILGRDMRSPAVELLSCMRPVVRGRFRNLRTDVARNEYGYGVAAYGCTDGVYDVIAARVRHGWTSGARGVSANSALLHLFGGSVNETVRVDGVDCYGAALDTHEDSYLLKGEAYVRNTNPGQDTSNCAVQLRGKQSDVDVVTEGMQSVRVGITGNGGGHRIRAKHRRPVALGSVNPTMSFNAAASSTPEKCFVEFDVQAVGDSFPVIQTNGSGVVVDAKISGAHAATDVGSLGTRVAEALSGSTINITDLDFDYSARSGALTARLIRVAPSSQINVRRGFVRCGASSISLADMNSGNGSASIVCDFDVTPAAPVNTTGSPTIASDISVGGVRRDDAIRYRLANASPFDATATLTALNERINVVDSPFSANRTITLPTTFLRVGQTFEFIRTANATGAFNWIIGSVATLSAPGTSCLIAWNGSAWVLLR